MSDPRDLVAGIEECQRVRGEFEERFAGYGVIGLPFGSGHVLALRRFPASSIGPGYRSVWHRDPDGRWTFFQDIEAVHGCSRYFGAAVAEVASAKIEIEWVGPELFSVTVTDAAHRLDWDVALSSSAVSRAMSAIGRWLPTAVWRNRWFPAAMGAAAGPLLRAGKVRLAGRAPNGQRFVASPLMVWLVAESTATLDGVDLGSIGPSPTPGRMGDFRIPQRGVFAIGNAFFR